MTIPTTRTDAEWQAYTEAFFEPLTHGGMYWPMHAAFCRMIANEARAAVIAEVEEWLRRGYCIQVTDFILGEDGPKPETVRHGTLPEVFAKRFKPC